MTVGCKGCGAFRPGLLPANLLKNKILTEAGKPALHFYFQTVESQQDFQRVVFPVEPGIIHGPV